MPERARRLDCAHARAHRGGVRRNEWRGSPHARGMAPGRPAPRNGGALLLSAAHAPFGSAADSLARRFGVDMSTGYTFDPAHADSSLHNPSCLVYSTANGLLGEHAITRGRDSTERVRRIIAFTGQS